MVGVFVAVAVIFFLTIIFLALYLPDEDEKGRADYAVQFDYMNVDIKWNADRSCRITQEMQARFFTYDSHGIYVDIPVNSGEKVRNLKIETTPSRPYSLERENGNRIIRAVVGDPDFTFAKNATLFCKVTYDYITPEHPRDKNVLALNAIGGGWTCPTKKATVTVTYPAAPQSAGTDYGIWIKSKKITSSTAGVTVSWSNDNKTVKIDIANRVTCDINYSSGMYALDAFENVELAYKMPSGALKTYSDTEFVLTLVLGALLVAASLLLKLLFAKNKPLSPIVDFYPPRIDGVRGEKRHMLPVQMGKVIDGSCSAKDVTSLIFYWASKGYLSIEERDNDTYFKKLSNIDEVTAYEKRMFDKLFARANDDGTVALSSLRGAFGVTVNETKKAVNSEYGGKLYKKGFLALGVLMVMLSFAFGACFATLTSLRVGKLFCIIAGVAAFVFVVVTVCAGVFLVMYYHKLGNTKRLFFAVLYFVGSLLFATLVSLLIPSDVMSVFEKAVYVVCLAVPSAIAPFFIVRTPYYDEQLNSILGFRNFLRDAEKDRLEALLADDPQYYYDILPYANVLGVSDIWSNKFKDIALAPPTYYSGGRGLSVFDVIVLNNLMNSVGGSLTYVPPKVNSGSLSRGGGGGGGFSGGSFGGGGGGRW
ncbi:MAG: DUF2207 domain-containing protein [Clostridiales bacterium]|nr:DUF2207 domain-containing protein [Clostridiales bacterium]